MQRTLNVREPLEDFKDDMVEEAWFWKPPIEGHRYLAAIDPSRGDASDRTAIEIIDIDGRDENGMPIIEQVMEFVGKRYGDETGQLAYQYATMYNNAYVIVDASGLGDSVILTLLNLGYENMYYEDHNQKTYTVQLPSNPYSNNYQDKLPGFHFQGNRFPVLSNFAGMVRNNEFKIRSLRVINELETWIFKGEQGRIDHQTGAHDDTLTCLAMGLFVMKYSLNKLEATKQKDAAILRAYTIGSGGYGNYSRAVNGSLSMTPKNNLPFYNMKSLRKASNRIDSGLLWLFR